MVDTPQITACFDLYACITIAGLPIQVLSVSHTDCRSPKELKRRLCNGKNVRLDSLKTEHANSFHESSVTEITFSIVVDPTLSRYYVNLLVFTPQNAVDGMEWIAQSWFIMK